MAILNSGATAKLACRCWLANRKSLLAQHGFPWVETYPTHARCQLGGGRMGDVCFAADITAGVSGPTGTSTAFVSYADIPALLREWAFEALGGKPDFSRDISDVRISRVGYSASSQ